MRNRLWRVLLVEDDEDDYLLTRSLLKEAKGATFELEWAQDVDSALQAMQATPPDVALVDYHLGAVSGLELIRMANTPESPFPYILLTGQGSYELDLAAMQAGAADYISKAEVTATLLERTIRYAIERHRLLNENREQLELLETMINLDPAAIVVFTGSDLRVRFANHTFRQNLPTQVGDLLGKTVVEVSPDEGGFRPPPQLRDVLKTGRGVDIPRYEQQYPDGSSRYFSVHLRRLSWQSQPAVLLIALETTAIEAAQRQIQMAAEDAVQRAEELNQVLAKLEVEEARLNSVIASAPSGILMVNHEAQLILANPLAERMFARMLPFDQPVESVTGLNIYRLNGAPYPPRELPLTRAALDGEVIHNEEVMVIWPDGQRRFILMNATPIEGQQGHSSGAVAVFIDITDHKKAQEQVRRSLAQIEVQQHLMQSRERERLRIAQDLHDGPLQSLISMTFEIKEMQAGMAAAELNQALHNLEESLQSAIHELRAFTRQLRPPVLTPFGLEKAIRSHADDFSSQHPELHLHLDLAPDGQLISNDTRLVLFRIFQELLNNIVRHANATHIWVRLAISANEVEMEVRDDGCGFEVPNNWVDMARQGHLGLVGVQERAGSVNGFVTILSQPGEGTTIRVNIPLGSSPQTE